MRKLFKGMVLLFTLLLFLPTLSAETEISDVYLYLDEEKAEFIVDAAPESLLYFSEYDNQNNPYEVQLEKICEKDTDICFTTSDSENNNINENGKLLTKYIAGKTYTYSVILTAKEGYEFTEETYLGYTYNEECEVEVTPTTLTLKNYFTSNSLIPIEKAEITDATLMFRVGDKVVFTGKTNSDLYSILYESWEEYNENGDYKEVYSDAKLNESITENGNLLTNFSYNEYGYIIILEASLGYTFTNKTEVTLNGVKVLGSSYNGKFYTSHSIDLTNRTTEEKNQDAIQTGVFSTIYLYGEYQKGLTQELMNELITASNNNSDITMDLTTNELIDADAKKEIDNAVNVLVKDGKVVSYLDLSIPVVIDGVVKGYITELVTPVSLTFNIPSDLPKVAANAYREYYVIRIHEGKATAIKAFDNGNGTITAETDQFSSYALVYTDIVNPATSDSIIIYIITATISLYTICLGIKSYIKSN